MLRKLLLCAALVAAVASAGANAEERGAWFREARFGMFIHWGLYSVPAKGEWIYARHPWKKGEYEALAIWKRQRGRHSENPDAADGTCGDKSRGCRGLSSNEIVVLT